MLSHILSKDSCDIRIEEKDFPFAIGGGWLFGAGRSGGDGIAIYYGLD